MADQEKKMAAALAAVAAYMQEEEAAYYQATMAAAAPSVQPLAALNLWGQSGRQEMMQMRNLMQMRAFDRLR